MRRWEWIANSNWVDNIFCIIIFTCKINKSIKEVRDKRWGELWRATEFRIRNFRVKIELFSCFIFFFSLVIFIHWFSFFVSLKLSSSWRLLERNEINYDSDRLCCVFHSFDTPFAWMMENSICSFQLFHLLLLFLMYSTHLTTKNSIQSCCTNRTGGEQGEEIRSFISNLTSNFSWWFFHLIIVSFWVFPSFNHFRIYAMNFQSSSLLFITLSR